MIPIDSPSRVAISDLTAEAADINPKIGHFPLRLRLRARDAKHDVAHVDILHDLIGWSMLGNDQLPRRDLHTLPLLRQALTSGSEENISPAMFRVSTHGPPEADKLTGGAFCQATRARAVPGLARRNELGVPPSASCGSTRPWRQPNTAFSDSLINEYLYTYIYICYPPIDLPFWVLLSGNMVLASLSHSIS